MAEEKVEFELVSPEELLVTEAVEMVVIPGEEGDFGVLPRHAPMLSTVRPGVISIYENNAVRDRIFVAGGFAEVTPERCTVLAEMALPVEDLDRADAESKLKDARDDLDDAKDEIAKRAAERQIAIYEAMLALSN
ncbi:MAG: F0F1 ATP synthase subunit epsilon [Rhodovibrionaceae bacterium]